MTDSHQKMRLVQLLRQQFGSELDRIPGFIEFAELARQESQKSLVDTATQTDFDLLEQWFPSLR